MPRAFHARNNDIEPYFVEQSMLPEDDGMIETCRSVLSVLMQILDSLNYIYIYICVCVCV